MDPRRRHPRLRVRPNGVRGIGDDDADRTGAPAIRHPDRALRPERLIEEEGIMTEPTHVDGNAAAGAFADVLGFDVTSATLTCAGCGRVGVFAESHVYHRAPGIVVRCPDCDHVLARLVQTPTDVWLDLRGAQSWRIPVPAR